MKLIRKLCIVLAVMLLVLSLAACTTKLSGTYKSKGIVSQSITFDDDKVTTNLLGFDINGTYVIEDDKITITYDVLGVSTNWEKSFKKDGNSIYIDGIEYVKQ